MFPVWSRRYSPNKILRGSAAFYRALRREALLQLILQPVASLLIALLANLAARGGGSPGWLQSALLSAPVGRPHFNGLVVVRVNEPGAVSARVHVLEERLHEQVGSHGWN